jgi:predicted amidohydrolase
MHLGDYYVFKDMKQSLSIAAVQLSSQDDVQANLEQTSALVRRAAERGAQVVLLPENFAFLGSETDKRALAEPLGDVAKPIQGSVSRLARECRITIVAGGFPEASDDALRPFNTCAVFGPDGALRESYRKIHLFDVELPDGSALLESRAVSPGQAPVVADVGGFRIGLSVCYDLRFPELYRALVDLGAEVLLVPAAFTLQTGKDHWHVLLRARAIEAQCFLVAAGQWGRHPKNRASYGHSLICDPWGVVIAECSDRIGIVMADLDRDYLEQIRARFPALKHRRLR